MTREEARELIGEYVLGSLSGDERTAFEAALAADPGLRAETDHFSARMQALDDTASPLPIPPGLWQAIEARTGASPARRRPALQWFAMAASVVVAAGLGFMAGQAVLVDDQRPIVVAVLVSDGQVPGAIVEAFANNSVHIIPLEAVDVPAGKVLEVWTKPNEEIGAVSLGRFNEPTQITLPAIALPTPQGGQLYEITLEDAPGSPTGKPTGPILFKGLGQTPV